MVLFLDKYEQYLINVKHASGNTVASYMRDLNQFATYLREVNTEFDHMSVKVIKWRG